MNPKNVLLNNIKRLYLTNSLNNYFEFINFLLELLVLKVILLIYTIIDLSFLKIILIDIYIYITELIYFLFKTRNLFYPR